MDRSNVEEFESEKVSLHQLLAQLVQVDESPDKRGARVRRVLFENEAQSLVS